MRVALALVVALVLSAADRAAADIGVLGTDPRAGVPGDTVTLRIGCGGCPPGGLALPVALVPAGRVGPHPCRGTSCASRSARPPSDRPYLPVGVARSGARPDLNRLRFSIPVAEPGLYTYVIWCGPCLDGGSGSLIGHPSAHVVAANAPRPDDYRGFLRIKPATLGPLWRALRERILAGLRAS